MRTSGTSGVVLRFTDPEGSYIYSKIIRHREYTPKESNGRGGTRFIINRRLLRSQVLRKTFFYLPEGFASLPGGIEGLPEGDLRPIFGSRRPI